MFLQRFMDYRIYPDVMYDPLGVESSFVIESVYKPLIPSGSGRQYDCILSSFCSKRKGFYSEPGLPQGTRRIKMMFLQRLMDYRIYPDVMYDPFRVESPSVIEFVYKSLIPSGSGRQGDFIPSRVFSRGPGEFKCSCKG